jgi:hypothetical protein
VKPLIPIAVEHGRHVRAEAGVLRLDADITYSPEQIAHIKAGWYCPKCWEAQSQPFPGVCEIKDPDGNPCCGASITPKAISDWLVEVDGDKWIGPRQSDADARAAEFERRGVWLP